MNPQPNNPLHGVTLEKIVTDLEQHYGWAWLAERVNIRCFHFNPTIKSSLKFLRRTPWARTKVESLYWRFLTETTGTTPDSPKTGESLPMNEG